MGMKGLDSANNGGGTTITEEVIHELKRLRIEANKDVRESDRFSPGFYELKSFRNGLNMAITVATQINNRRIRRSK